MAHGLNDLRQGGITSISPRFCLKFLPTLANYEETCAFALDEQWRLLLTDYRLYTPAEIAGAVRRVAEEAYYQLQQAGQTGQPLEVSLKALLEQRQHFTPAMIREENQMLEIRNNATYARPSAAPDRSRFARPLQELFDSAV